MIQNSFLIAAIILFTSLTTRAQVKSKHEDTEFYTPVPKVVIPGKTSSDPPSDAIILFDGKDLNSWVSTADKTKAAEWKVDNNILTVDKSKGNIETKQTFGNYQLHIEWQEPLVLNGSGQGRGNSGIFLASTGAGDAGYELQVLDSYNNPTYVNGQAGSIYKESIPLVNAAKKQGEWQTYDVIWTAPVFNADSSLKSPGYVTVLYNGVLVQNNFDVKGETVYTGKPFYKMHGKSPIKLQAHGDKSEPISFRNIWIREL